MTPTNGDPHAIENEDEDVGERGDTYEDGQPIELDELEEQQNPELQPSEPSIPSDPNEAARGATVSGRDEESDPDRPGAPPPGETM